MRLDRYLANAGLGTRKEVKQLIKTGRIKVNGTLVKESDFYVDFNSNISIDDKKIEYKEFYYLLLNKPKGYISATADDYHEVVVDLLPEYKKYGIAPVGRLDLDTTGVMLLTNHGALAHALLSPKKHVDKTYVAEVNHKLESSLIDKFNKGIVLDDGYTCLPATLEILDETHAKLTIHEGKFHQVKRMFKSFGYEVINLDRLSFDILTHDTLAVGEYRELTNEEVNHLLSYIK
ncbi:MAG: rRNA pseudouridine synthase [Erysipelotrichales bacterium]|nr:rRNA pseudouridine synthase [Erysipelotrichales bacterium]